MDKSLRKIAGSALLPSPDCSAAHAINLAANEVPGREGVNAVERTVIVLNAPVRDWEAVQLCVLHCSGLLISTYKLYVLH